MKIGIDIINSNEKLMGVDRYAIELISHLALIDSLNTYHIFYAPWQDYIVKLLGIEKPNFNFVQLSPHKNRFLRTIWRLFCSSKIAGQFSLDLIHITNPALFFLKKCPVIVTIHDMAEFMLPEKYGRLNSLFKRWIAKFAIKRSDRIITVSDYSKKSIIEILNIDETKVKVIPEGVCIERFKTNDCKDILARYRLPQNYILYVGSITKGKNIELIINAFAKLDIKLKTSHAIVIVGKRGNAYKSIVKTVKHLQLNSKVIFLDHVPDEVLPCIYKHAKVFVFPSQIEGFGLPVLEAMACGTPVITSNTTSLPDVCGDSAIFINPTSIEDCKSSIELVLTDEAFRENLINKGKIRIKSMTWDFTAKEILTEYINTIKEKI